MKRPLDFYLHFFAWQNITHIYKYSKSRAFKRKKILYIPESLRIWINKFNYIYIGKHINLFKTSLLVMAEIELIEVMWLLIFICKRNAKPFKNFALQIFKVSHIYESIILSIVYTTILIHKEIYFTVTSDICLLFTWRIT